MAASAAKDPENRMLWRANIRQRLDAESLRDAMLSVTGQLDRKMGGPPVKFKPDNLRRTVYGEVSRTRLDGMLSLFDFPNPNQLSDQRAVTVGPMQRLYFLNNSFVEAQAKAFADRLQQAAETDAARVRQAYLLAFSRPPSDEETRVALDFLRQATWPQYTQVVFASSEFGSLR